MRWILVVLCMCSQVLAEAFHEGQSIGQGNPQMDAIDSVGISISDNPSETQYDDDRKIPGALEGAQQHNEAFQMIKQGNKTRESYEIEVEMPEIDETSNATGDAVEGTLGSKVSANLEDGETIYKTCVKSGEEYTMTCRRQRMVEITIIPEVWSRHPMTCPGHYKEGRWVACGPNDCWQGGGYESCGGCEEGALYISQPKIIEFPRDEWVGCEDLERLHDLGQAEVISEVMGPLNETRIIDNEPITKDYWETTRTYAMNIDRCDTCEALKAIGCTQHDSECEEYTTGMNEERICKRFKITYACRATRGARVSKRPDLEAMMPPTQTGVANGNMYSALSQMEAMRQMSKHMEGDVHNIRIFRGQDNRCSINFGGSFKNCCASDGGFGTRMSIATTCSADEKKLAAAREKKLCMYVGSRVKKKVLGVVVSKENVFCCYPTKLGFAIQRGARGQLGKDFGTAEAPRCEGLTPDELSNVDFSKIDLSDTFADIAASAQKMEREIKIDMARKQRQFERPVARALAKENQPNNKRVDARGETHEIVY
jgi:hypothetical protein